MSEVRLDRTGCDPPGGTSNIVSGARKLGSKASPAMKGTGKACGVVLKSSLPRSQNAVGKSMTATRLPLIDAHLSEGLMQGPG